MKKLSQIVDLKKIKVVNENIDNEEHEDIL